MGPDKTFHFITQIGEEVTATYAGIGNIDHVISDTFSGSCWAAGITEGHADVIADSYFDHVPIVCDIYPNADQNPVDN